MEDTTFQEQYLEANVLDEADIFMDLLWIYNGEVI